MSGLRKHCNLPTQELLVSVLLSAHDLLNMMEILIALPYQNVTLATLIPPPSPTYRRTNLIIFSGSQPARGLDSSKELFINYVRLFRAGLDPAPTLHPLSKKIHFLLTPQVKQNHFFFAKIPTTEIHPVIFSN